MKRVTKNTERDRREPIYGLAVTSSNYAAQTATIQRLNELRRLKKRTAANSARRMENFGPIDPGTGFRMHKKAFAAAEQRQRNASAVHVAAFHDVWSRATKRVLSGQKKEKRVSVVGGAKPGATLISLVPEFAVVRIKQLAPRLVHRTKPVALINLETMMAEYAVPAARYPRMKSRRPTRFGERRLTVWMNQITPATKSPVRHT
tara:strand:- start:413 stop:1024 length:612 start_codon:yes stop_codon:yes gene_type:complete